jgi:hypothetical protein
VKDALCTIIAETKTRSAACTSEASSGDTFMSMSRTSYSGGRSAATVMSPRGGKSDFLPTKGRACSKLQYVLGIAG